MADIDKVKAKITFLQVMFVLAVGTNFSLIGWMANTEESNYFIYAVIGAGFLSLVTVFLTVIILKKINKLGDL